VFPKNKHEIFSHNETDFLILKLILGIGQIGNRAIIQLRVKTCAKWQRKDWNADDAERADKSGLEFSVRAKDYSV